MKPKFVHKTLPPEGLPLMRQYKEAMDRLNDDIERIQREAQAEAERVYAAGLEELKRLWLQMAPMVGLDAEKTWNDGEWGVESRYVDDGFAALTWIERPKDPLAMMMGGEPPPPSSDDEGGPPEGATIN